MRKLALMGSTALMLLQSIVVPMAAVGLTGCTSSQTAVTEASVANDINLIATSLNNALSQPAVMAVIPAKVQPQIKTALADLMQVTATVAADPSAALSKGTVASVEADVNTLVGALAGLSLPPPAPVILEAATVLLPVIETAVGMLVPASASQSKMSVSVARAHLATGH